MQHVNHLLPQSLLMSLLTPSHAASMMKTSVDHLLQAHQPPPSITQNTPSPTPTNQTSLVQYHHHRLIQLPLLHVIPPMMQHVNHLLPQSLLMSLLTLSHVSSMMKTSVDHLSQEHQPPPSTTQNTPSPTPINLMLLVQHQQQHQNQVVH